MFTLFIDFNEKNDNVNFTEVHIDEKESSTRFITYLLESGHSVEVWTSGCPLINYEDKFIKTDSDGFAMIRDLTLDK